MLNREFVIRFQIPRWTAARWTALALSCILVGGMVHAAVNWTQFAAGEKLSAAKMNANFKAIADATLKPHLVLNNGNVDLGVYLGTWASPLGGGAAYGVVFYPPIQAPLAITDNRLFPAYFTAMDCTGTPFTDAQTLQTNGWYFSVFNAGRNSVKGTIYVGDQAAQNQVALSQNGIDINGKPYCSNFMAAPIIQKALMFKDTKVPNLYTDFSQTSIVMM